MTTVTADENRDFKKKDLFPQEQTLFFVRKVKEAFRREGYVDAQVIGGKSTGKTAYADWCLYQTYGKWDLAVKFMFMQPRRMLEVFKECNSKGIRLPLVVVDDAGKHLNRGQWWKADIVKFSEFYNLIRTVTAACLFTEPSFKIPESIARDIKYTIMTQPVSKARLIDVVKQNNAKSQLWQSRIHRAEEHGVDPFLWCKATIYQRWQRADGATFISPDKSYDYFPLHYPNKKQIDDIRQEEVARALDEALAGEETKPIRMSDRIYYAYKAMQADGYSDNDISVKLGYKKTADLMHHIKAHLNKENIDYLTD